MIPYHGTPITPDVACLAAVKGGHAFVSKERPDQLTLVVEACKSFAVDNGAFSAWRAGRPVKDWSEFYEWADSVRRIPSCDFIVMPDVIDGSEADNDALLAEWPLPKVCGAPVWHMHESLERLVRLVNEWPRVCLGSSGEFSTVGTEDWWRRMRVAMLAVCDHMGRPLTKLHGLRMLNPKVYTRLPLASADSTNIARNIGIDQAWRGTYQPMTKPGRAALMRERIESHNAPPTWRYT